MGLIQRVIKRYFGSYNRNQILFIIDAVLINASRILTTGIYISGYMVLLKAPDFLVGILNSSAAWATIASIFSFLVYERLQKRKKFLVILVSLSRLMVCSIIFLPLFIKNTTVLLAVASTMVITGNILWGFYSVGWMVWVMSVSPRASRNDFIYTRMLFLRIGIIGVMITMGFVLDHFKKSYTGFLIIFIVSLLLSVLDIIVFIKAEEPEKKVGKPTKFDIAVFWEPIRNSKFSKFLLFTFLYYITLTLSSSYSPLFQIKYLRLDYTFVSGVSVASYIFMLLSTRFWSKIERKKGIVFVMSITSFLIAVEFLIYGFLTADKYYLLFIAPIFSGVGNSGFNVCMMNYRYDIMPEENKTVYEGWFGAIYGLSTLLAPVIGGILMQRLPVIGNSLFTHGNFQFLYIISFTAASIVILLFFKGPWKFVNSVEANKTIVGER